MIGSKEVLEKGGGKSQGNKGKRKRRDAEMQLNTPPDRMQINPKNYKLIITSTSRVESGGKVAEKNGRNFART